MTGPERIRAAIERDRGMYAPTADEIRALSGCCTPPDGFTAHPQPEPRSERRPIIEALFCPACIRFRFSPGHLIFCDEGESWKA